MKQVFPKFTSPHFPPREDTIEARDFVLDFFGVLRPATVVVLELAENMTV